MSKKKSDGDPGTMAANHKYPATVRDILDWYFSSHGTSLQEVVEEYLEKNGFDGLIDESKGAGFALDRLSEILDDDETALCCETALMTPCADQANCHFECCGEHWESAPNGMKP